MHIDRVVTGLLEENCYILEKDNKLLVVDPGDDIDKINKVINNREVLKVLITHKHFDHIEALSYFDKSLVLNNTLSDYKIGPFKFSIITTKGHTKDSVSYYFKEEKVLFSGDFLFKGTVGRCDLEGGNFNEMKESITKIKEYPKDITIYPGHGESTTLEEEIKNNPYFK